jgi:protein-tyrosine phosphatase
MNWKFWKKTTSEREEVLSGEFLLTDFHAHWLPGIDDGAKTIGESLEMIALYQGLGYKRLIATPHIFKDMYPNTRETIESAFTQVKQACLKQDIEIELGFAAEYMLDEGFDDHLNAGDLLCIQDKCVLVEQSMLHKIPGLEERIFQLQIKGYTPILAHPERYLFHHADGWKGLTQYLDMGCVFQLNLLSLLGYYGKPVKMMANQLLDRGMYTLAGTDAHHIRHLQALFEHKLVKKSLQQIKGL